MVQRGVLCRLISRLCLPRVHINTTSLETLQLELWLVPRVPGWETIVTTLAMEQDHVAKDTLTVKHAPQ